jgi:hypothetical protein
MKRLLLILVIIAVTASISFSEGPFTLIYWIRGRVTDAPGATANGRKIYFANTKASDIIGSTGLSGNPNEFLINAGLAGVPLEPGMRYRVFSEATEGYGVGPVEVEIGGTGYDAVGPFALTSGGGVADLRAMGVAMESTPQINVWFNNRLYQKGLGEEFYIPKKPKIKVEVDIDTPFALSTSLANYQFMIDSRPYAFQSSKISGDKATFEFTLPGEFPAGVHSFTFNAQSSGTKAAAASVTETIRATVTGGPLRILDTPLTFPSPFDPEKDKNVTFQYTLSDNANIDIFIFNITGEIIKKITINQGEEGGLGQRNVVKWDGVTDQGNIVSNGVYIGNIVARGENRVLSKFKLTVYR